MKNDEKTIILGAGAVLTYFFFEGGRRKKRKKSKCAESVYIPSGILRLIILIT